MKKESMARTRAMKLAMPFLRVVDSMAPVYMTDESDDCSAPPPPEEQMMGVDKVKEDGCKEVSSPKRSITLRRWFCHSESFLCYLVMDYLCSFLQGCSRRQDLHVHQRTQVGPTLLRHDGDGGRLQQGHRLCQDLRQMRDRTGGSHGK